MPTPQPPVRPGYYLVVRDEPGAACDGESALVKCGRIMMANEYVYAMLPLSGEMKCVFGGTYAVGQDTLSGTLYPRHGEPVPANLVFFPIDVRVTFRDMYGEWREGPGELKVKAAARFLARAAKAASANPRTRLGRRIVLRRGGFDAEADLA